MDPNNPSPYNGRGNVLRNLERYEEAIADYDQAIKLDPNNPSPYIGRGKALSDLKRHYEAIADYNKAIKLDQSDPMPYIGRGIVLRNLERYEEAIADYNKAIKLDPSDPLPYNGRGNVLRNLERYEEAIADYDKAIELEPSDPLPYNGRGNVLRNLERYKEAIADYDKAIELDPSDPMPYNGRGNVLRNLERYKEAIADYDKAIELDPTSRLPIENRVKTQAIQLFDEFQTQHEKELEDQQKRYREYSPIELANSYNEEILEVKKQLFGEEDSRETEANSNPITIKDWFSINWKTIVFGPAIFIILVILAYGLGRNEICQNELVSYCKLLNLLFSPLTWIAFTLLYLTLSKANVNKVGLVSASRLIARRLRVYILLIWIFVTDYYFEFLGFTSRTDTDSELHVTLFRYGATLIILISPFLIYYRHLSQRERELHVIWLSMVRERNRHLFWMVQEKKDSDSLIGKMAPDVLEQMNSNSTADIAVRMLHPKLDKERRWSLFGFGGNALSELEDKLEGLTDVIKRLELREPKQDEDKQKTKGNDTDVGATTDNK